MKKNLFFLFVFTCLCVNAQGVSDYQYIVVPEKFSNLEQYISNELKALIAEKNYTVLSENKSTWPDEARLNPCQAIKVIAEKVADESIKLVFKECNNYLVEEFTGVSTVNFIEALKDATSKIKPKSAVNSDYRENKEFTITKTTKGKSSNQNSENVMIPKNSRRTSLQISSNTEMQAFENNGQIVYKVETQNNEFVLLDASKSKLLATFYPAKKTGVYHVKVKAGNTQYMTIGYFEKDSLSYEFTEDFVTWELIQFKKK